MRKTVILFALSVFIISCSSVKKATVSSTYESNTSVDLERDGTSFEKAIVIHEKSESKGIDAEYAWIRQHYPGSQTRSQVLSSYKKKPIDIIHIITAEGKEISVYFDISGFYGKF